MELPTESLGITIFIFLPPVLSGTNAAKKLPRLFMAHLTKSFDLVAEVRGWNHVEQVEIVNIFQNVTAAV